MKIQSHVFFQPWYWLQGGANYMLRVTLSGRGKTSRYVLERRFGGKQFILDVEPKEDFLCLLAIETRQSDPQPVTSFTELSRFL